MKMKKCGIRFGFLVPLLALAGLSAAVMVLWNVLVPGIFGLATLNYWQAAGLFILGRLLFGGFGGFGHRTEVLGRRRNSLQNKWMKMTPEERKEFIKKRHFGHDFHHHHHHHPFFGNHPFDENCPFDEVDNPSKEDGK
jgi:hypothetical protein